jgi:hypothetical protein
MFHVTLWTGATRRGADLALIRWCLYGYLFCDTLSFQTTLPTVRSLHTSRSHVTCIGSEGSCNHIFTVAELTATLPPSTIDDILNASFDAYIASHANEFRRCPAPDCGYVYRVLHAPQPGGYTSMRDRTSHQCTGCHNEICRACHAIRTGALDA